MAVSDVTDVASLTKNLSFNTDDIFSTLGTTSNSDKSTFSLANQNTTTPTVNIDNKQSNTVVGNNIKTDNKTNTKTDTNTGITLANQNSATTPVDTAADVSTSDVSYSSIKANVGSNPVTVTVDSGSGQTDYNVKVSNGSANTSGTTTQSNNLSANSATNTSAKKMLADVDAKLAQYQGSAYKAPAHQGERAKAVAAVADSLTGAKKTAFLAEIKALGKDFGLNFGQTSIDDKTAFSKLDASHQAVNIALQKEAKTGQVATDAAVATTKTDTSSSIVSNAKAADTTPGVPAAEADRPNEVKDMLASMRSKSRAEVGAIVAGWDIFKDGRINGGDLTLRAGTVIGAWKEFSDLKEGTGSTIDKVADRFYDLSR
jgi:hypothetical protein